MTFSDVISEHEICAEWNQHLQKLKLENDSRKIFANQLITVDDFAVG